MGMSRSNPIPIVSHELRGGKNCIHIDDGRGTFRAFRAQATRARASVFRLMSRATGTPENTDTEHEFIVKSEIITSRFHPGFK